PTPADLRSFYDGVRSGIARLPGVEAVGGSSLLPFTAASWYGFQREDAPSTGPEEPTMAVVAAVEPGYFRSLGIPLKEGRVLDEGDGAHRPPSLLVDEALARRYFPGEDPVGRRITVHWGAGLPEPSYEVVGVVGEVRQEGPASLPRPTLYVPRAHDATPPWMNRTLWITVRTEGDPLAIVRDVSDVVWGLDRTVPVTDVSPLSDVLDRRRSGHRYRALLVGFFALLATVLATVGIGGVVAYAVAQRGHEIGIRRALGAEAGDVVRLSLAEGARLVGIGVPVGLLLAALASRALRSLLFGVEAGDVPTYVGVGLGLAAMALAAAWIPARRAAEVPPAAALRDGT
ncbi:MAG TPA: ABC transporter permease, partial [Longimicrobiales bacterium]|nr:ABC transporter permease [Longimicrobiales bacterium]